MKRVQVKKILDGLGELEFAQFGSYNNGQVGGVWTSGGGASPWELHPDTDELLYVLEGSCTVVILSRAVRDGRIL